MIRQTFLTHNLQTLSFLKDRIIDWANSGRQFLLNGQYEELGSYGFGFTFDSAVTCDNGIYSVIYQKLGTKGLLLKNGKMLREINRSYYQADVYEFPVSFFTAQNKKTYLIHCPNSYCQIDFEDVETGGIITTDSNRNPSDFFHSRFEVSQDNKTLLSKGWGWHPFDFVYIFDIDECIKNPKLLDNSKLKPDVAAELCTASFISNELVLIGSTIDSQPFAIQASGKLKCGEIAIWDIKTNLISKPITVNCTFGGHLTAIDENYAWDLYDYPKIINYRIGIVVDTMEEINSGQQISSIIHHLDLPQIVFNKQTKQVAIKNKDNINTEILTTDKKYGS
jgi:hypothetical protein